MGEPQRKFIGLIRKEEERERKSRVEEGWEGETVVILLPRHFCVLLKIYPLVMVKLKKKNLTFFIKSF